MCRLSSPLILHPKTVFVNVLSCVKEQLIADDCFYRGWFNMSGDSEKTHSFKVENKFIVKSGCKKRLWRSLKQILTAERTLPWPNEAVLYYSINAPPTFKPTKKYSDISGLPAPYIDRHSKLFYSNAEEFATVRSLPMDITAGYLQLRGVHTIVG